MRLQTIYFLGTQIYGHPQINQRLGIQRSCTRSGRRIRRKVAWPLGAASTAQRRRHPAKQRRRANKTVEWWWYMGLNGENIWTYRESWLDNLKGFACESGALTNETSAPHGFWFQFCRTGRRRDRQATSPHLGRTLATWRMVIMT